MDKLQDFSEAELEEELSSRKEVQRKSDKPCMIENPDYEALRNLCQNYIDDLYVHSWVGDDYAHYIFEAAMTTLFGKKVWDWINKQN